MRATFPAYVRQVMSCLTVYHWLHLARTGEDLLSASYADPSENTIAPVKHKENPMG